jgi:hypothetical protein
MRKSQRRQRRTSSTKQITQIPEEEAKRDECSRLKKAGSSAWIPYTYNLAREDGEEHCNCEGEKQGGGKPEKFLEEAG